VGGGELASRVDSEAVRRRSQLGDAPDFSPQPGHPAADPGNQLLRQPEPGQPRRNLGISRRRGRCLQSSVASDVLRVVLGDYFLKLSSVSKIIFIHLRQVVDATSRERERERFVLSGYFVFVCLFDSLCSSFFFVIS